MAHGNDLALARRFVDEGEMRVVQQQQLIALLVQQGRPVEQAEAVLDTFKATLLGLRNHLEIMQQLMRPRAY